GPLDHRRAHRAQGRDLRRPSHQDPAHGIRRMTVSPEAAASPDGHLLVDQLRFMARTGGDRPAYTDLDAGETITFRGWDERSNQVARWLVDHGVAKQDRVALYMDSDHCLQWIVAYAGIHKAGAVVVPVNTRLS